MADEIQEMYITDGVVLNSKYVLAIKKDGTVTFNWYKDTIKINQIQPKLVRYLNGMKIEYGMANNYGTRTSIELLDFNTGKLAKRWEKIK